VVGPERSLAARSGLADLAETVSRYALDRLTPFRRLLRGLYRASWSELNGFRGGPVEGSRSCQVEAAGPQGPRLPRPGGPAGAVDAGDRPRRLRQLVQLGLVAHCARSSARLAPVAAFRCSSLRCTTRAGPVETDHPLRGWVERWGESRCQPPGTTDVIRNERLSGFSSSSRNYSLRPHSVYKGSGAFCRLSHRGDER